MPELVNVVVNIVGVWPLIVSYLEKTGHKGEGDSLVVRSFLVDMLLASWKCFHHFLLFLEEVDERVQLARMKLRLFHLLLEICKCHHHIVNMIHVGT